MRVFSIVLGAACAGCSTAGDGVADEADTEVAAACTVLNDGTWDASGTCFGMRMSSTLAFDADSCTFTLTEWDMEMGTPNPANGEVSGEEVSLKGEAWSTCTATAAGPRRFTGTCEDGCAFEFALAD